MLLQKEVLTYANTVVEVFGKKAKATKYIVNYNSDGIAESKSEVNVILDRSVSRLFGFNIVFLEESKKLAAIWFCGKLVFNTVVDEYDDRGYDRQSKLLSKIANDKPGFVFDHGEWEDGLKMLAENAGIIDGRLDEIKKETEKANQWISDFNEKMLRFIPFKYHSRGLEELAIREYSDELVYVTGDLENRDNLKVYVFLEKKRIFSPRAKELVFDYSRRKYTNGPWVGHIEAVMASQKAKYAKEAEKYGYDPNTWDSPNAAKDEVQIELSPLSEIDCLEKIRQYST